MSRSLQFWLIYIIAATILTTDQLSKYYIRTNLAIHQSWAPIPALSNLFEFTHTLNPGAAFGMFKSGNLLFTITAIVVSTVVIVYNRSIPPGNYLIRLALGLQLGGALGNLTDRMHQQAVTDFMHIKLAGYSLPIFNIADASIFSGVVVLIILMWLESQQIDSLTQAATANGLSPNHPPPDGYGGGYHMSTQQDKLVQYEQGEGPIQTLTYWGIMGAMVGVIAGTILRHARTGALMGMLAGLIAGIFQLQDE